MHAFRTTMPVPQEARSSLLIAAESSGAADRRGSNASTVSAMAPDISAKAPDALAL